MDKKTQTGLRSLQNIPKMNQMGLQKSKRDSKWTKVDQKWTQINLNMPPNKPKIN